MCTVELDHSRGSFGLFATGEMESLFIDIEYTISLPDSLRNFPRMVSFTIRLVYIHCFTFNLFYFFLYHRVDDSMGQNPITVQNTVSLLG